ncbi:hypothetical protein QR680_010396 [Steinernema hermaphroditum]|uniref:Uncharacterized protein n=1 Tax=Steinernema hermaphroditum TaxID=289476 RepID=A0AA39INU0_9BILA|nr:hypothetical protein QR680_010396 [Steinernema hermaphroditum]
MVSAVEGFIPFEVLSGERSGGRRALLLADLRHRRRSLQCSVRSIRVSHEVAKWSAANLLLFLVHFGVTKFSKWLPSFA